MIREEVVSVSGNGCVNQGPRGLSAAISSPLNMFAGQGYRRGKVMTARVRGLRSRPTLVVTLNLSSEAYALFLFAAQCHLFV